MSLTKLMGSRPPALSPSALPSELDASCSLPRECCRLLIDDAGTTSTPALPEYRPLPCIPLFVGRRPVLEKEKIHKANPMDFTLETRNKETQPQQKNLFQTMRNLIVSPKKKRLKIDSSLIPSSISLCSLSLKFFLVQPGTRQPRLSHENKGGAEERGVRRRFRQTTRLRPST